jgi:hypothetical protein
MLLTTGRADIIQKETQRPSAPFTTAMTLPVQLVQIFAFASPVAPTPTMMTMAIKVASRAYSMEVTPRWDFMINLSVEQSWCYFTGRYENESFIRRRSMADARALPHQHQERRIESSSG